MSSPSPALTPHPSSEIAFGGIVPMLVCAGCRPVSLGYTSLLHGDGLEGMDECPCRDLCTWYAGHDLGGDVEYDEMPAASMLPAAFDQTPYFSCANFNDYNEFLANVRTTQQKVRAAVRAAEKSSSAGGGKAASGKP